ncbi:hypothetical protein J671_4170, partial [Acinetobacter sp. 1130196]
MSHFKFYSAQSKFYSGKKKKHTLKAQVIYHPN